MPCVCDLEHYIVVVGIIGAAGVIFRTIKGCTFRGYGSQRSKQQQGGLNGLPTKRGGERCSYILCSSDNNSELNVHMRRRSALSPPPQREEQGQVAVWSHVVVGGATYVESFQVVLFVS